MKGLDDIKETLLFNYSHFLGIHTSNSNSTRHIFRSDLHWV